MVVEVGQYEIQAWDCPGCDEVNIDPGQDDLTGEQVCEMCGEEVRVV